MKIVYNMTRKQAGDTIVEVLIAIAIAASVLGIVFAASSRNIRAARDIQEHGEATRLLQGQIESLRYAYLTKVTMPTLGDPFCMQGKIPRNGFTAGYDTSPTMAGYPTECTSGFYNYAIVEQTPGKYSLTVRWSSLTQAGLAQITMVYKVN